MPHFEEHTMKKKGNSILPDTGFPGDGLSPLLGDGPLVLHVALVPKDHLLHVLVGVFLKTDPK